MGVGSIGIPNHDDIVTSCSDPNLTLLWCFSYQKMITLDTFKINWLSSGTLVRGIGEYS
jgi:hypothetical protein